MPAASSRWPSGRPISGACAHSPKGAAKRGLQAGRQPRRKRRSPETMAELLVGLPSEEIPARMQARAAEDLKQLVTAGLKAAGLGFDSAAGYATPRRLTLAVDGLPTRQSDVKEERKGPRVGAPDAAIQGFLKSAG